MGETEDRVAAAIQKHAPELSCLSEQQRKESAKSIMLRASDPPQQPKKAPSTCRALVLETTTDGEADADRRRSDVKITKIDG